MQRLLRPGLLSILVLAIPVAAQQPPAQPVTAPASAQSGTAPIAPSQSPADYSQEPFVIEQYYSSARFENDGTGERGLSVRIHVQSDAGVQSLGELIFGYSAANEQMDIRSVIVHKADGTSVTAGPDAVKDMTGAIANDAPVYTDYREKRVTVPSLRPGDTLEYQIATRMVTPLAPGQFWFEHNFLDGTIVLDERLELNIPKGRVINLQSPDFPHTQSDSGDRTIYSWKRALVAHPTQEEEAKKKSELNASKLPDVRVTTFANWEEIAHWYAELEKGRTEPSPKIRAKTQELIQGRTAELEKIQALYDYVSKNIRYVSLSFGLGRYQPHAPSEVFANQYGDCKDKHTLLAAMLSAAGIPSNAVLIPSLRKLDVSMPSPSQFDHVITAVPVNDQLIWMDTTTEVAPFRLLAASLRNKTALLVPPDGAGKIVNTPADPPFLSTQRVEIDAQVSELGKLTSKLRYFVRGDNELALRVAFRRTPQTQWKELGQTVATLDGLRGEVTAVKPSDPSDTTNPFELDLEFAQPNFLDWSSKKTKVALPLVVIGVPEVPEDNSEPIHIGSPLDVTVHLKLMFPANYVAQPPVGVSVPRDYAEFKSSYRYEEHVLTVARALTFKMRELPASRTGDYLAFARAVESDESQVLSVQNASTGTPELPASAKPDELFETALAALNSGNTRAAIPLFQRVVELEPKHKQAWNDLGLAYLRAGKFDEAADAFRKQIGVNPFDEHAYNYLGLALQQQQKFDEAEAAFKKQIGVNPLDPVAHAALGGILLGQHKYAEAVPELDKASVLSPDNAGLQVGLGQAYLNTGETAKALAAFEKAAETSQTPDVWNNVAYNLADHKLDLEKAQQYAESAVSATAANLRNVELSNLTLDNLNAVASIGAYWDTLGWVYFQKGDDAKALEFIEAAWLLNQHGEVGDHLAQIYERRHEKDRAIQMYALAIAAPHSVPDTRARLVILLGGNTGIDALVKKDQPELVAMRKLQAGTLLKEDAEADFFVLLSPGEKNAKADGVKFISGSEKLRPFAAQLRALNYGPMFPDASPIKLVRRGTLACSAATGDCTFTLIRPEDVRTVN
jgi:tetratricopeptide (TPR) repeat protein/transglutaminase-like putative cysteine protease